MGIDADMAAAALARTMVHLTPALPGAWIRREGGLFAGFSGVALPMLNGVWTEATSVDEVRVESLLDEVAARGFPHCLRVRPALSERLGRLATRRGMTMEPKTPMMVLDQPGKLSPALLPPGCSLRLLSPDEAAAHAIVGAAGFEAPLELFLQLAPRSLLALPGVRTYLAEIDGQGVATGFGCTVGESVGIFSVATLPEYRRRGFGAAITRQAVEDGFSAGATWAWLESSPSGYSVYERLGFGTLEHWDCWVAAA
ncbi:MAG TPA: GNAT family N-acetyltransferase [Actinomycetota bacterium]|nr:GNAT family N-acetyltransferase [Actinomycetota bacterium]